MHSDHSAGFLGMSMKLGEGHQHENVMNQPLIAGVNCYMFGSTCYGLSVAPINSWSHVVGPLQVSEKLKSRFMSCADGDNEENARLKRENLRSVLECTDAWTILDRKPEVFVSMVLER